MKKKSSSRARKKNAHVRLPGDRATNQTIARMIRVDHAGEFGAQRIYAGQLAVLGDSAVGPAIRKMAQQEDEHLAAFEKLMIERHVRPTALHPVWQIAGYVLGAATAALGEKAAMACTVAVEETIVEHYEKQIEALGEDDKNLRKLIVKFRTDENHHREEGLDHGAEDLSYYLALRTLIRVGSKTAIWLSERV